MYINNIVDRMRKEEDQIHNDRLDHDNYKG